MKLSSLKEYPKDGGKMKYVLAVVYSKCSITFLMPLSFLYGSSYDLLLSSLIMSNGPLAYGIQTVRLEIQCLVQNYYNMC